jgi:hypothetical protein
MAVAFFCLARYIPSWLLDFAMEQGQSPRLVRLRGYRKVAVDIARDVVAEKSAMLLESQGNKDVMSLISQSSCFALALSVLTIM